MKTRTIALLALITLLCSILISGCGSAPSAETSAKGQNTNTSTPAATYQTIDAAAAKKMMDSGDPYTLVDVRTPAEYDAGHIKGAKLIPVDEIANRAASELPDKSASILLYCRTGIRAGNAAQTLAGMGYTKVYNFGGIVSWTYGTVSGN
jgi:rhodanese-related sulfurtransferase